VINNPVESVEVSEQFLSGVTKKRSLAPIDYIDRDDTHGKEGFKYLYHWMCIPADWDLD
jgi:hypothetical protein